MRNFKRLKKECIPILLLAMQGTALAQPSTGTMSEEAKASQKMNNQLFPQVQLPITYNYNPKLGANNGTQQSEFAFNPIIPISVGSDLVLILNPMLTYNHNNNNQQVTNQNQPLQLATFIGPAYAYDRYWFYGIGPYIQLPSTNANNGSMQTGVGVSAGAFYTPDNWVIGGALYNSWAVGSNMTGGSANVIMAQPTITYITDNAWSVNLSSQVTYNYDARNATNQLTLSGGKTIKVLGTHVQFQIGPTYMVTSNPSSSKGLGGYFGLTFLMPK